MNIDTKTGLLSSIEHLTSPHCDSRPDGAVIDLIVIHNISLPPHQFGGKYIEQLFCNQLDFSTHPYFEKLKNNPVSAHLLINRAGKITQFVPFTKRAWHAGKSSFQGKEKCNDFSIGIELEGTDELPFEKIQYEQLAKIISLLKKAYPQINRDRIVGHSDIAPGRKTDPGPHFDWKYLDCLLGG